MTHTSYHQNQHTKNLIIAYTVSFYILLGSKLFTYTQPQQMVLKHIHYLSLLPKLFTFEISYQQTLPVLEVSLVITQYIDRATSTPSSHSYLTIWNSAQQTGLTTRNRQTSLATGSPVNTQSVGYEVDRSILLEGNEKKTWLLLPHVVIGSLKNLTDDGNFQSDQLSVMPP